MVRTASWYLAGNGSEGGATLALALYSGSLASTLAVRLAVRAGVTHLRLVYFRSPFFTGEEEVGLRAQRFFGDCRFQSITLKRDFLALRRRGDGLSFPCGMCRWLLLERVGRLARRLHADLVVTGEVVGRGGVGADELATLDSAARLAGRVLRPLSARLLPPTRAEQERGVNRASFLDLVHDGDLGERMAAAARAAGLDPLTNGRECLLSDEGFVTRFQELGSADDLTENLIQLLRFAHSYRLGPGAQVVVAVRPDEQARLQPLFLPTDVRLYVPVPGSPLALVRASWCERTPEERDGIVAAAAERMAEVAGLPREHAWVARFRCEWEEETRQMRLPIGAGKVAALISS